MIGRRQQARRATDRLVSDREHEVAVRELMEARVEIYLLHKGLIKRCCHCEQMIDRELFGANRRYPDGRDTRCLSCERQMTANKALRRKARLMIVGRSALMQDLAS